jgi:DNA-binding NarL/FixJ family response regulator
VLSNLGQKEEVERCKKLGAEDFIIKATIGLDDIIPRIRAVLAKTKTHQ